MHPQFAVQINFDSQVRTVRPSQGSGGQGSGKPTSFDHLKGTNTQNEPSGETEGHTPKLWPQMI